MRTLIFLLASVLLFSPITADAQDSRAALEAVSKALGATDLKSIEIQGGGTVFQVGQSYTAGTAWPQFNVRSFTRARELRHGLAPGRHLAYAGAGAAQGGRPVRSR